MRIVEIYVEELVTKDWLFVELYTCGASSPNALPDGFRSDSNSRPFGRSAASLTTLPQKSLNARQLTLMWKIECHFCGISDHLFDAALNGPCRLTLSLRLNTLRVARIYVFNGGCVNLLWFIFYNWFLLLNSPWFSGHLPITIIFSRSLVWSSQTDSLYERIQYMYF